MLNFENLVFAFLLVICQALSAQVPAYRNYTEENGLPSNEVYHVLEDSKGYLWFSTDRGVSCYNGYEFKNYTTEDGLMDNTVFCAYEDERGRIWFLTFSSQLSYFENNSIHPYKFNYKIAELAIPRCAKISMSVDDELIIVGTGNNGYYQIAGNGEAKSVRPNYEITIFQAKRDILVSATGNVVEKVPTKRHYQFFGREYFIEPIRKWHIAQKFAAGKNKFYISDGNDLFSLEDTVLKRKITSLESSINALYVDSEDHVWVGFIDGGTKVYDFTDSTAVILKEILPAKPVSYIIKDREGGMWFTTLGKGIFYDPSGTMIGQVNKGLLPDSKVEDILIRDDDKGYVSYTEGEVWEITDTEKVRRITYFENQIQDGGYNPLAFDEGQQELITKPRANELLMKEYYKVMERVRECRELNNYNEPPKFDDVPLFNITSLNADPHDGFWVGTNHGMYYFRGHQIERMISPTYYLGSYHNHEMTRMVVDAVCATEQRLYVSTWDGLCEIKEDEVFFMGDKDSLLYSRVDDIKQLNDSVIIVASRGNGVLFWDGKSARSISVRQGLSNNLVNSICVEKDNIIWAGTNDGLDRITLLPNGKPEIQHFTTAHGLPSNHITKVSIGGNYLWIGTLKGLFKLNKNKVMLNLVPPRVQISNVSINNRDTSMIDNFILRYNENQLQFNYTGIAFKSEGDLSYQYRLEGLDTHWTFAHGREVRYTSLPYGTYTFKVKAANEDGIWSDATAIHFQILPPFWLRWWFIIVELSMGLVVVMAIIKIRESRIKEKVNNQKKVIQMELKALRAQMNPHFTFNTLASIQQFILQHEPMKANNYLAQFARLIRQVLENSRYAKIPLHKELETLKLYMQLEMLRLPDKLNFELTVDPAIDMHKTTITPSLIQPIIENSIIHGIMHKKGKGVITVEFVNQSNGIKCIITDNGIGREKAEALSFHNKNSLGIQIIKERLELMNASENSNYQLQIVDLKDNAGFPSGTRVEIDVLNNITHD